MSRIVLLVTVEDTGAQTPPLDPPTADAVRSEIQSNLESVWPYARIHVSQSLSALNMVSVFDLLTRRTETVTEPLCSICRTRGRHNHACE